MSKSVFLSFHYKEDVMRVSQVKQMGAINEQIILDANKWEEVKKSGDEAIKRWINSQMRVKDCVIVLIGSNTAGRKWVKYEIQKAWKDKKGLLGIYIHNLKDPVKGTSTKGKNPFSEFTLEVNGSEMRFDQIVPTYDPVSWDAYNDISKNIEGWVDHAIAVRGYYD